MLSPDRLFDPDPACRNLTRQLYESVAGPPIISPHGHVDPRLTVLLSHCLKVRVLPRSLRFVVDYTKQLFVRSIGF